MSDAPRPVRLFATDIDETLFGDEVAAEHFQLAWDSLEPERRPLLVYNSGRSVRDIQWLVLERKIPAAEFIIGGLGTELHDPIDANLGHKFEATFEAGWDAAKIEEIVRAIPGARMQSPEFLNPRKLSWHWPRASTLEVSRLEASLRAAALDVTVLYSGGIFLDVIPRAAGKGNALVWLCQRIGVELEHVLVAGATAANSSMFALPGVRGIVVGNASSELFLATQPFHPLITPEKSADGVLAGLEHFGVLQEVAHERS